MKQALKQMDKKVYFPAYALVLLVVGCVAFIPDRFVAFLDATYGLIMAKANWSYVLMLVWSYGVAFVIIFGKYGNIKLGEPDDKPRFSTFSWASMIFTSGIGSSIIIWGFAEPIYYLVDTPMHIEPMSLQAYEYAHLYGQFHWGFSGWIPEVPAVIAISYMLYHRKSKDAKISTALNPLFGKNFNQSVFGKVIDTLIALAILVAMVTSLGLGVPVLSALISNVTGIPDGTGLNLGVFAVWLVVISWSVLRGLERGIQSLTKLNMYLIFAFLGLFILATPAGKSISMELNTLGLMIQNMPRMVFYTDAFGDQSFVNNWTIFFWAWNLTFLSTISVFIAKISRGRTLKEVVSGMVIWGTLGCLAFFAFEGGYALYLQQNGIVDLVAVSATAGNAGIVLEIMKTLPFAGPFIVLLIVLCFIFLATTIDSTAMVLGTATSKDLPADEDPHVFIRYSWAIAIFAVAISMFLLGGLSICQEFAICLAFPLVIVVFLLTFSGFKAMKEDYGDKSSEEIFRIFHPKTKN